MPSRLESGHCPHPMAYLRDASLRRKCSFMYTIAALYHFTRFADHQALKRPLNPHVTQTELWARCCWPPKGSTAQLQARAAVSTTSSHTSNHCPAAPILNGKSLRPETRRSDACACVSNVRSSRWANQTWIQSPCWPLCCTARLERIDRARRRGSH